MPHGGMGGPPRGGMGGPHGGMGGGPRGGMGRMGGHRPPPPPPPMMGGRYGRYRRPGCGCGGCMTIAMGIVAGIGAIVAIVMAIL